MDKVKVLLFGMTGLGCNAFKVLNSRNDIELVGVFTPERHDAPFPYYKCEQLQDTVKKSGINLYEGVSLRDKRTLDIIESLSPALIVVSSFNQVIPQPVIRLPGFGVINIHPSLLPKYRGATPTVWVLMNGEQETGVTAHFIEDEKIDAGRIISQARLKIKPMDTDGVLRFKLAELSEKVLADAVNLVMTREKKSFRLQDESVATYFHKRTLKDAEINVNRPFSEILNKIRAMTPYPGATLVHNNKIYRVRDSALIKKDMAENNPKSNRKQIVIKTNEGLIKFRVAEETIKSEK